MRAELGGVGDGWRGIRRRLGAPPRPPSLRELAAGPGRAARRRLRPRSRRGPKERSPAAGRGAAAPPPPPGPAFGCCGAALRCLLTSALCFFFSPSNRSAYSALGSPSGQDHAGPDHRLGVHRRDYGGLQLAHHLQLHHSAAELQEHGHAAGRGTVGPVRSLFFTLALRKSIGEPGAGGVSMCVICGVLIVGLEARWRKLSCSEGWCLELGPTSRF